MSAKWILSACRERSKTEPRGEHGGARDDRAQLLALVDELLTVARAGLDGCRHCHALIEIAGRSGPAASLSWLGEEWRFEQHITVTSDLPRGLLVGVPGFKAGDEVRVYRKGSAGGEGRE